MTLGPFEIYSIETGRFRLDGGAMLGIIPQSLWKRHIQPDEKNRILMAMRCLLIKSSVTGRTYLIDNGLGSKFTDKMADIYQIDFNHSNLTDSLHATGTSVEEITDMVFTHLHFDHCGGTTWKDESGTLQHTFPNATYWVNSRHLDSALKPNIREKASFLPENIQPIAESNRLRRTDDNHQFEEGFSTITVNGHTTGQQLPLLEADGKTLFYAGDLFPTHLHIPVLWVMAYDVRPLETLTEKAGLLEKAAEGKWNIFLEHDADKELITVEKDVKRFNVGKELTLNDM